MCRVRALEAGPTPFVSPPEGIALSDDGRFVAFNSRSTNLVPGDTNASGDVFVHDRQTGQTTLVSVSSTGVQANANSHDPAFSAGGRFVAFISAGANLVPGDANNQQDVFVHDRQTGQTTRVNVSSTGTEANFGGFDNAGRSQCRWTLCGVQFQGKHPGGGRHRFCC